MTRLYIKYVLSPTLNFSTRNDFDPHNEEPAQRVQDLLSCPHTSKAIDQLVSLTSPVLVWGQFRYSEGVEENDELKRDNAKLRTAYDTNMQALSRHQAEFKGQKVSLET
jgi:hypothetical protein